MLCRCDGTSSVNFVYDCRREAFEVSASDVALLDVVNKTSEFATFIMYVYVEERTAVLNYEVLQVSVNVCWREDNVLEVR